MQGTDVLLVADADDPHALLVGLLLAEAGASVLTLNLSTYVSTCALRSAD